MAKVCFGFLISYSLLISSLLSGTVYERDTPEFAKFFDGSQKEIDEFGFPDPELLPGARAVISIDIELCGTSCGFAVPYMIFEKDSK